jgi:signal transduction histidine kinase
VAGCGGFAILAPWLTAETKNLIGLWIYPVASIGAGGALLAAAWVRRGRSRRAWLLLGLGVLMWAVGEVWSEVYWAAGKEAPYPGWMDVFYLAAYPLIGAGVALLPRPRLGKFERTRSALDAAAGILAVSLLAWLLYLDPVISFDPAASILENWTNAAYPIGDAILLLAVLGLAFRRSEQTSSGELTALGVALALNALADAVYIQSTVSGTYATGVWLDGIWFLGYAALAAAGCLAMRPRRSHELRLSNPLPRLAVAYGPVLALLGVVLATESAGRRYLTVSWVALAVVIVGRQWVANRETREIVEAGRDAVLASASHDLRTPLAAVQGYSQLLAAEWDSYREDERREMVHDIEQQALHLTRVVSDIIDATRGRAPAIALDRQPCQAGRLLYDAVASLPLEARPQVTVEAGMGTIADADPRRIHQVLVNLLTNALRYGKPPVLARAARVGSAVAFEIHDAGPGIPKRFEHSIWERFERGAHRHERASGGLGIGLPIARALVEAHGGSIHQRSSEVLGGACFEFTLPAATTGAPEAARDVPAPGVAIPVTTG